MLIYPGAFNMTTGPLHWELLQRSRANDNQLYVVTTSPARDEKAEYIAWGHSTVVNPWGQVLKKAAHGEDLISVDIGKKIYMYANVRITECAWIFLISRFFNRRTSTCTNSNFQATPLGYVYNNTFKIKYYLGPLIVDYSYDQRFGFICSFAIV